MTEKTNDSLYQEQKKVSPQIEDVIADYLNDDIKKMHSTLSLIAEPLK